MSGGVLLYAASKLLWCQNHVRSYRCTCTRFSCRMKDHHDVHYWCLLTPLRELIQQPSLAATDRWPINNDNVDSCKRNVESKSRSEVWLSTTTWRIVTVAHWHCQHATRNVQVSAMRSSPSIAANQNNPSFYMSWDYNHAMMSSTQCFFVEIGVL